jgi:hypothetical protein
VLVLLDLRPNQHRGSRSGGGGGSGSSSASEHVRTCQSMIIPTFTHSSIHRHSLTPLAFPHYQQPLHTSSYPTPTCHMPPRYNPDTSHTPQHYNPNTSHTPQHYNPNTSHTPRHVRLLIDRKQTRVPNKNRAGSGDAVRHGIRDGIGGRETDRAQLAELRRLACSGSLARHPSWFSTVVCARATQTASPAPATPMANSENSKASHTNATTWNGRDGRQRKVIDASAS